MRVDAGAVRLAVVASLPFYLNAIANTVYARVDVSMLAMLSNDTEVGWYGAASNFAALALLVSPLVGWVLLPLLARAAKRSDAELFELVRRATKVVLLLVLPVALFLHLGADVWILSVFGAPFAPAIPALRLLAPMFVFTYLAMIQASCLILLGKAWTVTAISVRRARAQSHAEPAPRASHRGALGRRRRGDRRGDGAAGDGGHGDLRADRRRGAARLRPRLAARARQDPVRLRGRRGSRSRASPPRPGAPRAPRSSPTSCSSSALGVVRAGEVGPPPSLRPPAPESPCLTAMSTDRQ